VATNKAIDSSDVTFFYWPVALAMVVAQSLGIITACIPYLKPFIQSLESGMIRSDDIRRRGGVRGTLTHGYLREGKSSQGSGRFKSSQLSRQSQKPHELGPLKRDGHSHTIASITVCKGAEHDREWDVESHSSRTRIITQTKTWGVVTTENAEEGHAGSETNGMGEAL
jgi:hypothetical protein